jgi:dipeptidase
MNFLKSIIIQLVLIHFSGVAVINGQEFNCFSILVGKGSSADGSVLFAHNEDDSGDRIVNIYKVPASEDPQSVISAAAEVFQGLPEETWSHLWLEMPEMKFSDSFMNQWGVTISSNACRSREDTPELTDGGIGYMLRMTMARQARSAREAVQIGGRLISAFGYASSGRTYCIADPAEAWMLAVVHGKQWVAQRVPYDHIAFIPNYYTISYINLEDTLSFYGSENLVDYARERGWYNPETDGTFSFRKAYGDPESISSLENIIRHWSGLNMISDKQYGIDEEFPFSIIPENKVGLADIFRVLRNHNEGTRYDGSEGYSLGNPHSFYKTICTETTQYGFVAQLRSHLPPETGYVLWMAPFRPCVHPFVPLYFGMTESPEGFYTGDYHSALETHFEPVENVFEYAQGNYFPEFVKHARIVDEDYKNRIEKIRVEIESFENELLRNQESFETNTAQMTSENPGEAERIINGYVSAQLMLSLEMIREH